MKQKLLLIMALTAMTLATKGQRIDFCAINRSDAECLEPGYQKWAFDRVPSATGTFTADDGRAITITVSAVEGLAGNAVRSNHWKATVQEGFKLTGDACYVGYMPNLGVNNDFENITAGSSGVQFVIEGLKEGPHSLMAYHNMIEGVGTPSPLKVVVNGQTVSEGVQQTVQQKQTADCGQSYVMFSAKDGETVTIQYISTPDDDPTYTWTGVALNALIFDDINLAATASEPVPANEDYHVDAEGGTYTLSWRAAEGAVRHHVLMGTSATDLQELGTTTENSFTVDGLKNINFYYWRVDEEMADGQRYPGIVWSFRPRHLAFPGAEGYGRFANGGRGGIVYHVTNLNDDNQPGSFRYAVENLKGPRTIVFDVSGFIALGGKLTSSDPFLTVAGQTAPGKGICFGRAVIGFGSDHIIRHIRNRVGSGETYDGMGFRGARESIMDHCSISWSIDEGFSSREAGNITLQRTLISEALNMANHDKYDENSRHGFAAVFGGDIGSFHHNLLANNSGRNPRLDGGMDANGYYMGRLDIFNNVVYNWNSHPSYGESHEANFHRNFYKMGPATTRKWILIADVNQRGSNKGTESYYFMHNVLVDKNHKVIFDGTKHGDGTNTNVDGGKWQLVNPMTVDWNPWVDEPFFPSYATVETANDAYKTVLSDVGCNQPVIDDHDQRQISETQTGTNKYKGSKTGLAGLPDTEEDVGGWELYPEGRRAADFDTDQDGMPDWWEHLVGSNSAAADNNEDPDGDGYTLLEDYLNFMGEEHVVVAPGEQTTIDIAKLFVGFTKVPAYSAEVTGLSATGALDGSTLTVKGSEEGLTTITLTVTDAEGSHYSRQLHVAVSGEGSQSAVRTITAEDIVSYELFDLNGRRLTSVPQQGAVYLMKAVDQQGSQHVLKAIKK